MSSILIFLILLGFLVAPVFTLAVCRSAGKADRQLEQMRASTLEMRAHKTPPAVFKMEPIDLSKEKTQPILHRMPISVE